jgi:hypothetical protein
MNYYQAPAAGYAPEADAGRITPQLIDEFKRSGFWAGFLGWTTLAVTLAAFLLVLFNLPSSKSRKSVSSSPPIEYQIPDPEGFPGSKSGAETSAAANVFSGVYLFAMIVSMLAAVGMVIMLVWYNVAMKQLIKLRSYAELHRISILQRRLWVCIGLYCVCSLINTAIGLLIAISGAAAISGAI